MSTPEPASPVTEPALAAPKPLPESVKAEHRRKLAKATAKRAVRIAVGRSWGRSGSMSRHSSRTRTRRSPPAKVCSATVAFPNDGAPAAVSSPSATCSGRTSRRTGPPSSCGRSGGMGSVTEPNRARPSSQRPTRTVPAPESKSSEALRPSFEEACGEGLVRRVHLSASDHRAQPGCHF